MPREVMTETATASGATTRRWNSRVVVLAVAVIAVVAGGVWWVVEHSSGSQGPLRSAQATADSGAPRRGVPVSIGDITFANTGSKPAVITSITPVSPTPGLRVRFLVGPAAVTSFGEQYGVYRHAGLRPAHGYTVAPSPAGTEPVGVVAILSTAEHTTRNYDVRGVNIHYRAGDSNYTLFIDEGMTVCYTYPFRKRACNAPIPVVPGSNGN